MNKIIEQFEAEQITRQLPDFGPGDTVVVNVKVKEGNRERVQAFEGIVIAKRSPQRGSDPGAAIAAPSDHHRVGSRLLQGRSGGGEVGDVAIDDDGNFYRLFDRRHRAPVSASPEELLPGAAMDGDGPDAYFFGTRGNLRRIQFLWGAYPRIQSECGSR